MARIHLFELEDQSWFPAFLRDCMTDYLTFMADKFDLYAPCVPLVERLLEADRDSEGERIVDLCAGAGGPAGQMHRALEATHPGLRTTLTDKFPHKKAAEALLASGDDALHYVPEPVDATAVDPGLEGVRTIYAAFHHFPDALARQILADAARQRRPIGVFEVTERSPQLILASLFLPFIVMVATIIVRPFRLDRLIFTYVIPILPWAIAWDGFVSCLRTRSVEELEALVATIEVEDYRWEAGQVKTSAPAPVTYLLGLPTPKPAAEGAA